MALVALHTALAVKPHLIAYCILVLSVLGLLSLAALGLVNSLLQLYDGVLGVKEGLVVSSQGFSPLTALISRSEIEQKISNISDITVDYYLVTPILVGGKVLVLRSTNAGTMGSDCVLIGDSLAYELGVHIGDHALASSVFTGEVYYLEICGYTSGYVLEAPYDLVARVRGVAPGYYSYAVVRGSGKALEKVLEVLNIKPSEYRLTRLVVAILPRIGGNRTRSMVYHAITEAYIANFGLQRDYIEYFALAVATASTLGSVMLGLDSARRLKSVFRNFTLMGLSKRKLLLVAVALGVVTGLVGFLLSILLYNYVDVFTLRVLGFTIKPSTLRSQALAVFLVLLALYVSGLTIGAYHEVE